MKNDDILITYSGIQEQIRRARLERSIYLGQAIAIGLAALGRVSSRIVARLQRAHDEAPRISSTRRLSPR